MSNQYGLAVDKNGSREKSKRRSLIFVLISRDGFVLLLGGTVGWMVVLSGGWISRWLVVWLFCFQLDIWLVALSWLVVTLGCHSPPWFGDSWPRWPPAGTAAGQTKGFVWPVIWSTLTYPTMIMMITNVTFDHTSNLSRIPRVYPCKFFLAGVTDFTRKKWRFFLQI